MDSQKLQILKNKYDIVGSDAALNLALEMAAAVAPTDLTVLVTGESGAGKDAIPQIIHQNSRRKTGKYLAVNCGAIPEGTISAELFGHEKGAFTGAVAERKGYFEEANGGTLFLDEIGELPRDTQAMLLRVLQTGEYIKVGSSKVEKTDVRVIAATNASLEHLVAAGKFREDLYYRLNAVQIKMPSLRERKNDIYLLFRKFSADFAERYGLCRLSLSHDAISALQNYRWPGNVRQLKNITEAITALESQPATPTVDRIEIDAATIARYIPDEQDSLLPSGPIAGSATGMSDDDRQMIVSAFFKLNQEVDTLKKRIAALEGRTALPDSADGLSLHDGSIQNSGTPGFSDSHPSGASSGYNGPAASGTGSIYPSDDAEWQETEQHQPGNQDYSIQKANAELFEKALERCNGNVKKAAAELGISERTIYRYLAKKRNSR